MELRVVITVLSIIVSGFLQTVTPAPTSPETEPVATTRPSPRHIRTKRCSCATFLDKECIYFCHLDIIWVNTPERTVSYGLGSAPRKKRSLEKPLLLSRTQQRKRCQCADKEDSTCSMFCQPDNTPARSQAARLPSQGSGCTTWRCLYNRAANKGQIKRTDSRPWSRTSRAWQAILRRAPDRAQARAQGGKKAAP